METLTQRLKPLLTGAVSLDDLDNHTRQALDIYVHFRSSALCDLPSERIKAEIEAIPEGVRELVRAKARELWKRRLLCQNNISTPTA